MSLVVSTSIDRAHTPNKIPNSEPQIHPETAGAMVQEHTNQRPGTLTFDKIADDQQETLEAEKNVKAVAIETELLRVTAQEENDKSDTGSHRN